MALFPIDAAIVIPTGPAIAFLMRTFTAVVEKDSDTKLYVGDVPGFPGAHSQAETLDELQANLREVIEMLLEDTDLVIQTEFIGTQQIVIR